MAANYDTISPNVYRCGRPKNLDTSKIVWSMIFHSLEIQQGRSKC